MANLEFLLDQPISPTEKLRRHIAGIINAYHRFPYMNRLIHYLLHESSEKAAGEVSRFFVTPLLEFQRRLLAEGITAGEFRKIDPALFYTSLVGACDHLFFGRHAMSRATGVGPVTDEVCRQYIEYMEALICGGVLNTNQEKEPQSRDDDRSDSTTSLEKKRPREVHKMQLQDVAVLITGGGSGLGAATARAMAAKGAKVAVLDLSKENAKKVAAEVKGVALDRRRHRRGAGQGGDRQGRSRSRHHARADELRRHRRLAAHRRQGRGLSARRSSRASSRST